MSVIQIVTLVVFVLAGALLGYNRWRTDGPIPQQAAVVEEQGDASGSDEPDPSVVPPVVDKAPE